MPSPCKKQYATETKTKEQNVNGERSEATQEAGIMKDVKVTKLTKDRKYWRSLVAALCAAPHEED